jgi:hypothetical protein
MAKEKAPAESAVPAKAEKQQQAQYAGRDVGSSVAQPKMNFGWLHGLSIAMFGLTAVFLLIAVVPAAIVGFTAPWSTLWFGCGMAGAVVSAITAVISRYLSR